MVVVRVKDQHPSTSLILVPALSEPRQAQLGFLEFSFLDDPACIIPCQKGYNSAFLNLKLAKEFTYPSYYYDIISTFLLLKFQILN